MLGYPVAYLLAHAAARWRNLLMILGAAAVLDLAAGAHRAWIVLLQKEGIVNDALLALGLIDEPLR